MALTPEEIADNMMPSFGNAPKYPYGLCISLCEDQLEKLKVDSSAFEVGQMFHLHAFAKITSISASEREDGKSNCRVELQIVALGCEDEAEEDEEAEEEMSKPNFSGFHKRIYTED
jgi:hypothetical protein